MRCDVTSIISEYLRNLNIWTRSSAVKILPNRSIVILGNVCNAFNQMLDKISLEVDFKTNIIVDETQQISFQARALRSLQNK